ncbi:RDD family protein [Nocardia brasiliensis]|uniref:RDD family protein n=1 Tax=Nocardia brasiliensis TaxID=37326 RepID=UPI002458E7CB|nr:RDD family protein [Nocardia brasiliensis]
MGEWRASGEQASTARRLAAWGIDFALIVGVAVLLGVVTHYRVADYLSSWTDLGQTGVWDVVRSNGDWGGAGKTFGLDVVQQVLLYVIEAFVALIVVTFGYQFVSLAWRGRTVGKALLELEVRSTGDADLRRSQAAGRAFAGTMTDVGLYAAACIALLAGKFALSLVLWLIAVGVLIANAVPVFAGKRRSVIDRLCGTAVVRAGLYRQSWETARDSMAVQRGIRGARTGLDKAQGAAAAAKDSAARLAEDERVRQVRESEPAQRVVALGQQAGRRTGAAARQVIASERGQQAQRVAKLAGGALRNAYDKRRGGGDPGTR